MNWFQNLSVRLKILSVAGLGIALFVVYAAYSYYIAETNIDHLQRIEKQDFPVLEMINANNVEFISISESYIAAITQADADLLSEAKSRADAFKQRLAQISRTDPTLRDGVDELSQAFSSYISTATSLARGMIDNSIPSDQMYSRITRVRELQNQYEDAQKDFEKQRYEAFRSTLNTSHEDNLSTQKIGMLLGLVAFTLLALIALRVTRAITRPLEGAVEAADNIANGKWNTDIADTGRDETGQLLRAIRKMRDALVSRYREDRKQETVKNHLAELNARMRGDMPLEELGNNMLSFLVPVLEAQVGAFYTLDQSNNQLTLSSSYAMQRRKHLANAFKLGESLVGQCALERKSILLEQVPEDYISISSGTGVGNPRNVVVMPIIHEEEVKGVLELGSFNPFSDDDMAFLEQGAGVIGVSLHSAQSRLRLGAMLEQTRQQAEELAMQKEEMTQVNTDLEEQAMELAASESRLQQQQEELKAINEELESQTQALRASEESLQAQQEELRVTNEELEAQARLLTEQKTEMAQKNDELEKLRHELEDKIKELELSSKYKSEFLSTMSHELRTPLNSILILSNALGQNKKGNLDEKQVEHAQVIHSAGSDLLSLINDILDISKIEEGKMDVVIDDLTPQEMREHFRRHFAHVAESRGLEFHVDLGDNLPEHFYTDRQRLEQIIKNLLSNALKFTDQGSVTLGISRPDAEARLPSRHLVPGQTLCFSVTDTGVGIPEEKQKLIFEAFQQADGTTSRKYGGTGLGLTISRELARLLGGEISLYSDGEGQGATFMFYVPIGNADTVVQLDENELDSDVGANAEAHTAATAPVDGANEDYVVREKTVLVVEDDEDFAGVLVELAADYGLESHVCSDGESGLEYASHYRPSAIILDIGLPGIDGWEVMEKLKADPRTQDIPVHFLSGKDERKKALELGAIDFMTKPVNQDQILSAFAKIEGAIEKNVRRLLVVEDSEIQHESIRELFDQKGVEITAATSGQEALEALRETVFDCMILDLTLPDMSGFELLEKLHGNDQYDSVPVVIYTGKDLTREEEAKLRKYADRIILKTERSHERLLNEASLFLHWLESTLPSGRRPSAGAIEHRDDIFEGKQLLLVDDDMRNIYALSAQMEELGFEITLANNGREALEALDANPAMDIVLMDIMMPEMDGYEAMGHIREQKRFAKLPILALTAKAMKDDRAKCIDAGANDYCSKPIDMAKLTSLLRVWLHK
ncbi:sensor histidine kinase/respose regulator [Alcanivorax hongdengensis A-11-3]|uniref:histidine kinase n=1 Tax=Alcanivorax hongdengensis A-11-3 TaxID=1177179 RepID=L0WCY2_9GAMM|nr:response regulator [Alcanivorax hongdengensis]EKF73600.1 sensor histidine kinase/respose regulator [Alcanivorax hongdengensis A-11-3]